jgi:hypothetical protein
MTKTISSSTTRYLPVAQFLRRVDQTIVAQLCSDDPDNPVEVGDLASDDNLAAAIMDAEGEVEAAALLGERYTKEDLQALAASTTAAATGKLWRLISDIAWVLLWERRPNKNLPPPPSLERSNAWLEQLALGKRIFGFAEAADAGLMDIQTETATDVQERNGSTFIADRLFGRRANREIHW